PKEYGLHICVVNYNLKFILKRDPHHQTRKHNPKVYLQCYTMSWTENTPQLLTHQKHNEEAKT
ncbi:hypothetical protein ACK3HF_25950, partial [Enterobacter kobei]|uniref:hypothetical protein n=1 Tax=Enterobacter kobei TaxID=208224 RepID=UPI003917A985